MLVTEKNGISVWRVDASVFAPVSPERLYEAVLDVRGFPRWAPGVRRVELLEGLGEPGMVSEWEVSAFGLKKKIISVLDKAEPPELLRWSYAGPVGGWGECRIQARADGALAGFVTELRARDSNLVRLLASSPARSFARNLLKNALARLGQVVSGESGNVRVGPLVSSG